MNRPTRIQTFIDLAHVWAKRATCMRLNVGAVIVVDRRAVSHGYNGAPTGASHCLGNDCPGKHVCHETIHAEKNALLHLPEEFARPTVAKDCYTTDSPCQDCAELLFGAGVKRVFFSTPYRVTESLDWLIAQGVEVYRVTPAGYIVEWSTKNVVEVGT